MTTTYLVKLEIGSPEEIDTTADDLQDSLINDGFDIISVEPWARPTLDIEGGGEEQIPLF